MHLSVFMHLSSAKCNIKKENNDNDKKFFFLLASFLLIFATSYICDRPPLSYNSIWIYNQCIPMAIRGPYFLLTPAIYLLFYNLSNNLLFGGPFNSFTLNKFLKPLPKPPKKDSY